MKSIIMIIMMILALCVFGVAATADTTHHKTGSDTAKEKHATIYLTKTQAKTIKEAAGKPVEIKLTDHQKEVIKEKYAKFAGSTASITKEDIRTKNRVRFTSNDDGSTLIAVPPPKPTEQPKS